MLTRADIKRLKEDRGPSDLTRQIEDLQKENYELIKKCRHAGRTMIELNLKYEMNLKGLDRLSEENTNLKTMLKGSNGPDSNNNAS